jgi:hypothetical protein
MASINKLGNITARCPGCDGALSTFEYAPEGHELGRVIITVSERHDTIPIQFRLFRCAGCGIGGLGRIKMMNLNRGYPKGIWELLHFTPEVKERLQLPKAVPRGIVREFREAEVCAESGCYRASAAMFRSVLDKTLRANGYKTKELRDLKLQIDAAANDGVITKARQRRAHEEVRVFGNDVLHDEWHAIKEEDVEPAHLYTQRILEDLYDDRESVLAQLKSAGREADELKPKEPVTKTP